MTTAQDLISNAENFAGTQAMNAANFAIYADNFAAMLLGQPRLQPPVFNRPQLGGLGPVTSIKIPDFAGKFVFTQQPPKMPDFGRLFEDAYRSANPTTQAELMSAMRSFIASFAPGYYAAVSRLESAVADGVAGAPLLSAAAEQAFVAQAYQRIERERRAQRQAAQTALKRQGYELPVGLVQATLQQVEGDAADRRAEAATTVLVEVTKLQVQHKQFCMGLSEQINGSVRSGILQFAGIVAGLKQFAVQLAQAKAQMALEAYRAEVQAFITLLEMSKTRLSADVETYRAKLDGLKANLEVQIDSKKLEYERMRLQLEGATVKYKGELEYRISEAQLKIHAMQAAVNAVTAAAHTMGQIAQAAMSGINGIAQVNETV